MLLSFSTDTNTIFLGRDKGAKQSEGNKRLKEIKVQMIQQQSETTQIKRHEGKNRTCNSTWRKTTRGEPQLMEHNKTEQEEHTVMQQLPLGCTPIKLLMTG